jgi:hypothetical protein
MFIVLEADPTSASSVLCVAMADFRYIVYRHILN